MINEKTFVKKSKKILNKLEESRSKSYQKVAGSRNASPGYDRAVNNLVDTRKYVIYKLK
jgi:hypothetical protein